jgi:hypothetical protein
MKFEEIDMRRKAKKLLDEVSPFPGPQSPIKIGDTEFTPPFYSLGNDVTDVNQKILCTCANLKIARGLANILWEHL